MTMRNVYWAANQHIGMISEGSCDTVMTDENYILKYIHIENSYFKL